MKKLAIITTHPIQYNAPLFQLLNERGNIDLKVFYTWGQSQKGIVYDPGFNKAFQWDIPLINGYNHEFIINLSTKPGTKSFFGIVNKGLIQRVKEYDPDALLIYGWSFYSHLKLLFHFAGNRPPRPYFADARMATPPFFFYEKQEGRSLSFYTTFCLIKK